MGHIAAGHNTWDTLQNMLIDRYSKKGILNSIPPTYIYIHTHTYRYITGSKEWSVWILMQILPAWAHINQVKGKKIK